jgi:hypothetical protein
MAVNLSLSEAEAFCLELTPPFARFSLESLLGLSAEVRLGVLRMPDWPGCLKMPKLSDFLCG